MENRKYKVVCYDYNLQMFREIISDLTTKEATEICKNLDWQIADETDIFFLYVE